jgi:hypothetical protein
MKRAVSRPGVSAAQTGYLSQVVATIADFALRSGLPPQLLITLVQQRIASQSRGLGEGRGAKSAGNSAYVVAPNLLSRWHKNLRLLDDLGNPRPLPLRGAAPSVESLIRAEKPRDSVSEVLRFLQDSKLIRRSGSGWVPAAAEAIVQDLNATMAEHSTQTLLRFLETMNHNLREGAPAGRLIERCAVTADFPPEALAEFRHFVRDHGADFLTTVDNWMGSRAARASRTASSTRRSRLPGPAPGADVGVHLFAWVQTPPAA